MQLHLPAGSAVDVAVDPDGGDVGVVGHGVGAAGGCFGRVVDDSGDLGSEEGHLRVADDDGCESAHCVELVDEVEDVLAGPDVLLDVGEVSGKELVEVGFVAVDVGVPEDVFLGDDFLRFRGGLCECRKRCQQKGQDNRIAYD